MWISKRDYDEMQSSCDNCNYKLTEKVIRKPLTAIYTNNAIIMSNVSESGFVYQIL